MVKILITGANGQLGSELKELSSEYKNFSFYFVDIDSLDITDYKAIESYLSDIQPNYLVNCAAYTAVDNAEKNQQQANMVNNLAVQYLSDNCTKIDCRFIHISTDYVYNGNSCIPHTETDIPNPTSVYGKTKLEGEKNCNGNNSIIIRTSWLYSSYGNNFVKTMLRLADEHKNLNVIYDQIGTPTYANDLANAILSIIEQSEEKGFKAGIYNYSNEGVTSWYDFATAIFEISAKKCKVFPILTQEYKTLAERPKYSVMNKAKIKTTYHLSIPHWRESLKKCIKNINYGK